MQFLQVSKDVLPKAAQEGGRDRLSCRLDPSLFLFKPGGRLFIVIYLLDLVRTSTLRTCSVLLQPHTKHAGPIKILRSYSQRGVT